MYVGKFTIDDEFFVTGYTDGQTWNGWATPIFELDEAKKIIEWVNEVKHPDVPLSFYDEDTDTFVRGKRVIHLKLNTLVNFVDPIPIRTRRSGLRGIKYTTLQKMVNAENTDDL